MLNEQALSAYINVMFEPPVIRAQRHQTSLTTPTRLSPKIVDTRSSDRSSATLRSYRPRCPLGRTTGEALTRRSTS